MKVAVIGGGAVGLGLASCLVAAGASVHLQVRSERAADALRRRGLVRTGVFGTHTAPPGSFTVGTDAAALAAAAPESILVCTKTPEREQVAELVAKVWPRLRAPAVVLCQNGWGSAERFADRIPARRVFNATVTTGFRRAGDERVEITVHGDEMHVGSLFGAPESDVAPLCAAIAAGGIPCSASSDMQSELWAKLLYNCALNPLAAVLGTPYGALGESPETRRVIEAVVREIFAVIEASGRRTKWPSADEYLAFFFRELLPPTRLHESSMLQDLRAGRQTEIDALSGAVVQQGLACGVATPVNAALATIVRALHPAPGPAA